MKVSSAREFEGFAPCDPKKSRAPQTTVIAITTRSMTGPNGSRPAERRIGAACHGGEPGEVTIVDGGEGSDATGSGVSEVSMANGLAASW
jgi:hypothetical protein